MCIERWSDEKIERMRRLKAEYKGCELYDFGCQGLFTFEIVDGKEAGDIKAVMLSRSEAQKLYNDLWRFGFRPEGMKYCEGNHAPK